MKRRWLLLVPLVAVFALLLGVAPLAAWASPDEDGEITVHNDSDHEVYIVIGGYNQGRVWKGGSETYKFKFGSHKVEAQVGNESAKDWVNISPSSPHADVTFNNDDFPDVPVKKR